MIFSLRPFPIVECTIIRWEYSLYATPEDGSSIYSQFLLEYRIVLQVDGLAVRRLVDRITSGWPLGLRIYTFMFTMCLKDYLLLLLNSDISC